MGQLLCTLILFCPYCWADTLDIQENAQVYKIRLPFNSAFSEIGTAATGIIRDQTKRFKLEAMNKYTLKFNALGKYDLSLVQNEKQYKLGELEAPFSIVDTQKDLFHLNKRWYRGKLEIANSTIGIIALNELGIETLLTGIISPMVTKDSYPDAIKAAAVILRSSLNCLNFTPSLNEYHFSANALDYAGIASERGVVTDAIRETEGEVLLDSYGRLACTPFRSAVTENALPFELIGYKTGAWEKTFSFAELQELMNESTYKVDVIFAIEKQLVPGESKIIIRVKTEEGDINLSTKQCKDLFGLPSSYFRIYQFRDHAGLEKVQFLGGLAGMKSDNQHQSILNLVDSLEDSQEYWGQSYQEILSILFPGSYLAKI